MMVKWAWPRTRQTFSMPAKQFGGPPPGKGRGNRGNRGGSGSGGAPSGILVDTVNITTYKPPASTGTHTFSHIVTSKSNQILVLCIHTNNALGRVPTSATFNGDALTQLARADDGSSAKADIWYRVNPDVGTFNVVVTFSGSVGTSEGFSVLNIYNVHQVTPWGTAATNTGNSSGPATVDASSAVKELVIDCLSWSGTAESISVGAGQTGRVNTTSIGGTKMGVSTENGSATVTMSWTKGGASNTWAIVACALKPA